MTDTSKDSIVPNQQITSKNLIKKQPEYQKAFDFDRSSRYREEKENIRVLDDFKLVEHAKQPDAKGDTVKYEI